MEKAYKYSYLFAAISVSGIFALGMAPTLFPIFISASFGLTGYVYYLSNFANPEFPVDSQEYLPYITDDANKTYSYAVKLYRYVCFFTLAIDAYTALATIIISLLSYKPDAPEPVSDVHSSRATFSASFQFPVNNVICLFKF